MKIGATKDGTITAATAVLRYQDGAFASIWGMLGAMTSFACYDLANVKSIGYDVLVNRPKVAAYRAPSAPMAAFAVESTIDQVAEKLGMDPVDFRIKNAAKEGTRASYGPTYGPIGIGPTLQAAKNHPHMKAPLKKNQGRGMACGFWFNFGGQTCTDLNIGVDGTVSLTVGTVDVGGSRASLSLIAAEELGIPYDRVKCTVADTASLGHNDTTEGSRGTFSSGMATIFAARQAIGILRERAAKMWDIDVADVAWKDGRAGCAARRAWQSRSVDARADRRQVAANRRTDRRAQRSRRRRRGRVVRDAYLRHRSGPGDRARPRSCVIR